MRWVTDRLNSGEPEAPLTLEELYRQHSAWLSAGLRRRFGRRLCHEDLVQETYLRAARLLDQPKLRHPRAFLWRVANHIALDQLRRLSRSERVAALSVKAEDCAAVQDETVLLRELVCGLPATVRETFLLSRFSGLSYDEIASRQGISVKAVEWRISRALELLAGRLAE